MGLEKAAHKCVGFCEIDAKARGSYKAIHNTEGEVEMDDITTVSYGLFDQLEVSMLPVEDFRVRLSRLQENGKASKILGELSSLKLQGSHLFSEHAIYSLKMLKDCSTMKEELRSRQLYEPWMNWGTTWNGNCLTAKIMSHKIENVSLLSDILEDNVPKKYFLSQEKKNQLQFIIRMFITKRSMLYYFRSKFMTVATQGVMLMCIFLLRRRE